MSTRQPLEGTPFGLIAEALEEPHGRATFVRGLMLGTLVGAAVVGSLLRARQRGRTSMDAGARDGTDDAPPRETDGS